MTDAVWCTPTRGITYSVSHHVGFRLVHPDTWYQLFGLPSCRMTFGAPRHVVSIIRSPIMSDAVWCTPTRGINLPFGASRHVVSIIRSPIMSDAVWCTPTHGINYSVSHHAGCRLVHLDTWYQLNVIRHQNGCRLVHPAKWDIEIISGCLRDGCRLVHPVRRFILHIIQFTFTTDSG